METTSPATQEAAAPAEAPSNQLTLRNGTVLTFAKVNPWEGAMARKELIAIDGGGKGLLEDPYMVGAALTWRSAVGGGYGGNLKSFMTAFEDMDEWTQAVETALPFVSPPSPQKESQSSSEGGSA